MTRLEVTVDGDNIHTVAGGDSTDLAFAAIAGVQAAAKMIYAALEDELEAEKFLHEMQRALAPQSKIWCFLDSKQEEQ